MRWWCLAASLICAVTIRGADAPGLAVTLKNGTRVDVTTLPHLALYVVAGKAASPFIPEGKFTAIFDGNVVVDLRSDFFFDAELNGTLKLEINGTVVLEGTGPR